MSQLIADDPREAAKPRYETDLRSWDDVASLFNKKHPTDPLNANTASAIGLRALRKITERWHTVKDCR